MDFKNYVRMMLEAEKAEDQDKEKAEDQDEEDEDDSDEDEDDDEAQASVKTKCIGCEASADTEDDDDEDEDDDEDDDDDEDEDDEKEASGYTKKSLKESIIYSSRYATGTLNESAMSAQTQVLVEGINNNSASKYLAKLSKKAEKEAAKYAKKGWKEEATKSKKAASSLKEASAKLYRCETKYKAGDVTAKKEYKQVCRQYSKELKNIGKGARGLKKLIFTVLAGSILLGGIGITAASNDNIIDQLDKGFKNPGEMPGILKRLATNDKETISDIVKNIKETDFKNPVGYPEGHEKVLADTKHALGKLKGVVGDATERAKDKAKGFDWANEKEEIGARADGWDSVEDREDNIGYKAGKTFGKAVKTIRKGAEEFGKEVKKTTGGIGKGFQAGK